MFTGRGLLQTFEHFCVDFALGEWQEQLTAAVEHDQRRIERGL